MFGFENNAKKKTKNKQTIVVKNIDIYCFQKQSIFVFRSLINLPLMTVNDRFCLKKSTTLPTYKGFKNFVVNCTLLFNVGTFETNLQSTNLLSSI